MRLSNIFGKPKQEEEVKKPSEEKAPEPKSKAERAAEIFGLSGLIRHSSSAPVEEVLEPASGLHADLFPSESSVKQEAVKAAKPVSTFKIDPAMLERAVELYGALLALARRIKSGGKDQEGEANGLILALIDELNSGNDDLVILSNKTTRDDFRPSHIVNTTILAVKLGIVSGMNGARLVALGHDALFHKDEGPESGHVLRAVVPHAQAVSGVDGENTFNVDEETESKEIINLSGKFEDETHERPGRKRKSSFEALKALIEGTKEVFERSLVKRLIDAVSVYPLGSLVELNNGEVGEVVRVNKNLPTRPVIRVILDKDKRVKRMIDYLDLVQNPMIHVKTALDDEGLVTDDKLAMMKFKLRKWWVE